MKKRILSLVLLITMLSMVIAGCGTDNNPKKDESNIVDDNRKKLVIVVDKFSYDVDYENMLNIFNEKLKELKKDYYIDFKIIDNVTETDSREDEFSSYSKEYQDGVIKLYSDKSKADIIVTGVIDDSSGYCDYDRFYKNDLLLNLDDYFSNGDNSELYALNDEKVWRTAERKGSKYIFPTSQSIDVRCWNVENKMLTKAGITAEDLQCEIWDLAENEKLKDLKIYANTNSSAYASGSGNPGMPYGAENYYDMVTCCVGVKYEGEKAKAINIFDDEYMIKSMQAHYKFYTSDDYYDFCIEQVARKNIGIETSGDFSFIPISDKGYLNKAVRGLAIASWSENADSAFDLICELNTNKELALLINYGIEGENYTLNDDGTVSVDDEQYENFRNPFQVLSHEKALPKDTQIDTIDTTEDFSNAIVSPICDFIFDPSVVEDKISAVNKVILNYSETLLAARGDYDTLSKEFKSDLEKAGVNEVVDEVNRQIAEW